MAVKILFGLRPNFVPERVGNTGVVRFEDLRPSMAKRKNCIKKFYVRPNCLLISRMVLANLGPSAAEHQTFQSLSGS